ncbi:BRO-N domain-containing protein [Acetobacter oryzoeni]|uniref:Phage antirepressor protein n=1 Tax=Acetobacter oryzoeni TaxID=2500548 RepID=A0A5B9GTW0_9PROT|nr:BRO family protein [Acetobacter oryzoeni]MCP1203657.1 BRO family protein [Acetobacter oryzoeni]QEE86945.1 phage antirepressor protein [Acetobacter oryzoeni]
MSESNDVKLAFEGKILVPQEHRGQRWFLAKDVCQILELRSAKGATRLLDDDEVCLLPTATAGGTQNLIAVNESGAYHLTFTSRKPVAKRFRRWVTEEVLPQIRRTGEYRPDKGQDDVDLRSAGLTQEDLRLLAELKEGDIYQATRHLVTRMNGKFSVERALSEAKRPWSYDLDILELIHLVKLVQISWFALGQNSERSDQMRQYMCRLSAVMRLLDDKFGTGPYFEPVTSASPERS